MAICFAMSESAARRALYIMDAVASAELATLSQPEVADAIARLSGWTTFLCDHMTEAAPEAAWIPSANNKNWFL
jgi:hypothetical protein